MADVGICIFDIHTDLKEKMDEFKERFLDFENGIPVNFKTYINIFDIINKQDIQKANIDEQELEQQWQNLTRYGFEQDISPDDDAEDHYDTSLLIHVNTSGYFPNLVADMFVAFGYGIGLDGMGEEAEWIGHYGSFYYDSSNYSNFDDYSNAMFEIFGVDPEITEDELLDDDNTESWFELDFLLELIRIKDDEDDEDDYDDEDDD